MRNLQKKTEPNKSLQIKGFAFERQMNRVEVITAIDEAFAGERRPTMFIEGTCSCEECIEHNETMLRFTQKELPLNALNNPGWDPICFASDHAFRYLMPGLVRLVLRYPDDYIQQFLFHIERPPRLSCLTPFQARAVMGVLDLLTLENRDAVENDLAADDLLRARKLYCARLDQQRPALQLDAHQHRGQSH